MVATFSLLNRGARRTCPNEAKVRTISAATPRTPTTPPTKRIGATESSRVTPTRRPLRRTRPSRPPRNNEKLKGSEGAPPGVRPWGALSITMNSNTTNTLPMFGGIISSLAAHFRLTDHVRTKVADVSEGTARRALSDQPDVAPENLEVLLAVLVDSLFTADYLVDRGLSEADGAKHNAAVVVAVQGAARSVESVSILATQTRSLDSHVRPLMLAAPQQAIAIRLAAYVTLYDRHHPAYDHVGEWLAEEGLAVWYASVVRRAGVRQISKRRLADTAGIDETVIKKIKNGKSIPLDKTITTLASALVKHQLFEASLGRALTKAEILFELRLACAVARLRETFKAPAQAAMIGPVVEEFVFLRSRLRVYPREAVEELLARGIDAKCWPALEEEIRDEAMRQLALHAGRQMSENQRLQQVIKRDPRVAARQLAQNLAATAAVARGTPIDSDGTEPAYATAVQDVADFLSNVATDRATAMPRLQPKRMEAEGLVMQAIAPWATPSREERERLLRRAVEVCPDSVFARTHLAMHLRRLERDEEAIACLRDGVAVCTSSWALRYDLALLLGWNFRHAEALDVIDAPGATEPMPLEVMATRGFSLVRVGRLEEGEALLRQVLSTHPSNTLALHGMAACHRANGDTKRARELERKAEFLTYGALPARAAQERNR